ncbi:MAG: YihY/virulence factor BrkB family protein [Devosia sp.]|nr:YihY/virulence factor BrkB family protein [Devosia sp.]
MPPSDAPPPPSRTRRAVSTPARLPWRQIALRVFREVGDDRAFLIAAGVTYYMLLALVPSLAVFVSIYGLFADSTTVNTQVDLLVGILPPGGVDIIREQLQRLTAASHAQLSVTLILSIVVAFWSAGAGIRALIDAMNVAYDVTEQRPFLRLNLLALIFTLGALLAAMVFVAVVVVIPAVLHQLTLDKQFEWLVRVASYFLMLVMALFGLDILYRFGPYRLRERWHWITPGAAFAVVGITVVSVGFSWYAANFSNYNATYGSLGALVGFLTWIWLSMSIVIIGAELNAEIEHHRRVQQNASAG